MPGEEVAGGVEAPCSRLAPRRGRLTAVRPRSGKRIVHSELDVKFWALGPPSCDAGRPACCPSCDAPSREPGKPLTIVGHGLRARGIEGPHEPGEAPTDTSVDCRRYVCRACKATLVVVPRGVGRGLRYSVPAIAYALALWAYALATAAQARQAASATTSRGFASPEQWSSLRRWTSRASAVFGPAVPSATGTLRERAARVASWLASQAPVPTTRVPHDAFFGGRFVHAR